MNKYNVFSESQGYFIRRYEYLSARSLKGGNKQNDPKHFIKRLQWFKKMITMIFQNHCDHFK